jgi:ABC-2 type transport system ATP-binding protein
VSLVIDAVTKRFAAVTALDGITFSVTPGEIFGFLGANGAGKTTTMRIVLDVLRPDSGAVTWHGRPNTELPRRTWGYLPEERGLYGRMAVLDQLVYFATLYGVPSRKARADALGWLERFGITTLASRKAEELSKGNQQKVQFIAAILHDPDVLLMDEPFTGLDPVNVVLMREAFFELREQGKTLIFSTHQMETAEAMCESIAIIDRGRLVIGGPLRAIRRASGRRHVRLSVDDPLGITWLEEVDGVRVVRRAADAIEVEIERSVDPSSLLAAAVARGEQVTHFEILDPSLEQIFIEHVGRSPDDDSPPVVSPAAQLGAAPETSH